MHFISILVNEHNFWSELHASPHIHIWIGHNHIWVYMIRQYGSVLYMWASMKLPNFLSRHRRILFKCRNYISQCENFDRWWRNKLIPRSSRVICCCYDNKTNRVAWAQVHSISFPADQDVNFNSMDKFKFWTDFEKEIEFWKCSFKLLNTMLIKKSNLWQY